MGKIFGISNLPVTIFTTPLEPIRIPTALPHKRLPLKIFGLQKDTFQCGMNSRKPLSG